MLKLKNSGLQEQTVKIVGFYLKHLAVNSDSFFSISFSSSGE
jgi:hypothetical protein